MMNPIIVIYTVCNVNIVISRPIIIIATYTHALTYLPTNSYGNVYERIYHNLIYNTNRKGKGKETKGTSHSKINPHGM